MQVEDFTNLSEQPLEKLLKLRDVARDNFVDIEQERNLAWNRLNSIMAELTRRMNDVKASV